MPTAVMIPEAGKARRCTEEEEVSREGWGRVNPTGGEQSPLSRSQPQPDERTVSILVVEDQAVVAVLLMRKLRSFGYLTPEHAVSGQEAIEKAERYMPDLILMDINLRGAIDGITAALQIQAKLDIPVIFVTAYSDRETVSRAEGTKCYGFLTKPVSDNTLRSVIAGALARIKAESEAAKADERGSED